MNWVPKLVISILVGAAYSLVPHSSRGQSHESIIISTMPDTAEIMQQIEEVKVLKAKSPEGALSGFSRILRESRILNFGRGIRNALLNIMVIYNQTGRYKKSIEASYALLEAADSSKNRDAFFYSYYWRALSLHRLNQFDAALDAYTRALYFLPDSPCQERIIIYSNMGELMYRLARHKNAVTYFTKAITEGQRMGIGDSSIMTYPYSNMANSYGKLSDFHKADSCFAIAIYIAGLHQNKEELYAIKRLQASMYNERKWPEKTLTTIAEARKLLPDTQQFKDKRILIHQLDMQSGEAYLLLGDYTQAKQSLLNALNLVDTAHHSDRSAIYQLLSRVNDSLGNFKLAYKYLLKWNEEQFKVANKDIEARFNESEIRFRTAEKEKELAEKNLLLSESEKNIAQKNLLIVSLFSGGFLLCLIFLWLYFSLRRKQKMNRQQQEIEHLKSMMKGEESERIRLARELHDGIGGMLTAIKMNAGSLRKAYPETAQDKLETLTKMLADTSAEVRTTAHNLMPDALTRYGLLEAITQYIGKINESSAIEVELHTPNASSLQLEKPVELILYRMVQELIQNVIKHAEATHIALQLLQHSGQLTLTVEDNGRGFDPAQVSGFGLENLKYRVQALHGELETDSQPGHGTTIRILFDVEKLHKIST